MEIFRYGDLLGEAWSRAKKNYWMILLICVVLLALGIFSSVAIETVKGISGVFIALVWIVSVCFRIFLSVGVIRCLVTAADDEEIIFSRMFSGADVFLVFLLGSLAYMLVYAGGLILLVIPGFIWAIKYSFVHYLIADKGLGVKEAFAKSAEMTSGYKWNLFFLGVLTSIVNIAGFLCLGVGLFVTIPLTIMLQPIIYRKLDARLAEQIPADLPAEGGSEFQQFQR